MEVQYVPVSLAEGVPPRTLQKGLSRGKRLGDTSAVTKQIGDESAMTRQKSFDRASFFVCRCLMRNLGYTCTSIHTYVSTVRTKSGSSGRESLDQRTKRQLLPACASLAEGKAITTKERWRSESRIQKGGGEQALLCLDAYLDVHPDVDVNRSTRGQNRPPTQSDRRSDLELSAKSTHIFAGTVR